MLLCLLAHALVFASYSWLHRREMSADIKKQVSRILARIISTSWRFACCTATRTINYSPEAMAQKWHSRFCTTTSTQRGYTHRLCTRSSSHHGILILTQSQVVILYAIGNILNLIAMVMFEVRPTLALSPQQEDVRLSCAAMRGGVVANH